MDEDKEKRAAQLGFYPQRENTFNQFLPFADEFDEESAALFYDIKTNLIKSLLAREISPGCVLWTSHLHRFMRVYGYSFSKDEHICLVKLYYELLTIPNIEPLLVHKFGITLNKLLEKKSLLSRDELELPWKPIYDLTQRLAKKNRINMSPYRYNSALESTLGQLIRRTRPYFPLSATKEILDIFRPQICPHKEYMVEISTLSMFLPVALKPSDAAFGYRLWFEEFMNLLEVFYNANLWENSFVSLLSELAAHNIGYINWDPYVPMMFARFQRTMKFPVTYKNNHISTMFKIETSWMTKWIVSCLGGPSDLAFRHLESFMQAIASYYISANVGRWSGRIREFLWRISRHFVDRIHNERYKVYTWENQIPNEYKLTDADIDRFVNLLKPCLEYSIFGRQQELIFTLNYLSRLRPQIIVPIVLNKLYTSMESITEPHKLTSAILCLTSCARYMVQGKALGYSEGPTHVFSLLMDLLPGIDPNDRRKCYMTFNFMGQFVNLIPLVDSSEASKHHELTDEEQTVCEESAGCEDFVLEVVDRLCIWISSNSLESTRLEQNENERRKTSGENVAESVLISFAKAVLGQSSPAIFTAALKKMFNYVTNNIFEIKVSGILIGILCQSFCIVNPKETCKLFIPYFCDNVESLLREVDLEKDENLNDEILYNLLILSEVMMGNREILPYMDRIIAILDKVLYMTSMEGYTLGTQMLFTILGTLVFTIPVEYRSLSIPFDTPIDQCLTIRNWGQPVDRSNLNIKWYIPGDEEIACVKMILYRYMVPELRRLDAYANGDIQLTRQELRRTFKIIVSSLGCLQVLPLWKEPAINFHDSVIEPREINFIVRKSHAITMPDGSNIRKTIADVLHRVQSKILQLDEGDTKSIVRIIAIYDMLLFNKTGGYDFESRWKYFHGMIQVFEDRVEKRNYMRKNFIERVQLQHELRADCCTCLFTETHKQILLDLYELSTCRYTEVRIMAQSKVNVCMITYIRSYLILEEKIKETLMMDSTENHEKFKGCLYVLLGPKHLPLITRHNWAFIKEIWPLVIKSKQSEKPSIVALIECIISVVHKMFPTITIDQVIDDKHLKAVYEFAATKPIVATEGMHAMIANGRNRLQQLCDTRKRDYTQLVDSLLQIATVENLHWRYFNLTVCFLRDLIHPDVKCSPEMVKFFLKLLLNDSLRIRKIALKVVLAIIGENKIVFPKTTIDPFAISNVARTADVTPGFREDNKWLMYDSSSFPKGPEEWNLARYIHDDFTGYYCWPETLEVFDYSRMQSLKRSDMLPQQKAIHDFFCDKENIETLIKYHSMEEKKGKDKFSMYKSYLFKYVFKMFESEPLELFLPHLERLVEDKQEQSQRCAAEILCGVISGCKHWDYEQTVAMWTEVIPLLRKAFNNISSETLIDWSSCIGIGITNRDPNRYNWLFEFLIDDPLSEPSSFLGCARLSILFSAVNQNIWRNPELYQRVLTYINMHLQAPFQNIRNKISLSLSNIFANDILLSRRQEPAGPRVKDFIRSVEPYLVKLYELSLTKDMHLKEHEDNNKPDGEKDNCIRLFKTVAKYVTTSLAKVLYTIAPEQFLLLPLACVLQGSDDDELETICKNLIGMLASSVIPKQYLNDAIRVVKQVSTCRLWSARVVIAEFIPVFVFHNMANIIHTSIVQEVISTVLILLEDEQPEVQIKASEAVSGFLHVNFIPEPLALLEEFRKMAATRVTARKKSNKKTLGKGHIRYAGVLGLCSFISSNPYDVPDYLPPIFADLDAHLNDPDPIPAAIRKTMGDFKRTHHANWEDHKQNFTENELCILTDITVPPSYYA